MKRRAFLSGPIGKARIVLVGLACCGAVGLAVAAFDDHVVTRQCETFVAVPCFMETSTLSREPGRDDRNMPGWNYVPTVRYRYTVEGREYQGDTVSSRPTPITSKRSSDEFLQKFGPGANAECHVNPEDPTDAMLELPTNDQAQRMAKFGGLAVLLSLSALGLLQVMLRFATPPKRRGRAPGWGEADSGPRDVLGRTRQMLKEKLDS